MRARIHPVITDKGVQYIVKPVGVRYWFGDYALCSHVCDSRAHHKTFANRLGFNFMVTVFFNSPAEALKATREAYGSRIIFEMWEG